MKIILMRSKSKRGLFGKNCVNLWLLTFKPNRANKGNLKSVKTSNDLHRQNCSAFASQSLILRLEDSVWILTEEEEWHYVLRVPWVRGLDFNSTSGVALWTRRIHFLCQHLMVRVWFLQGIVCWRSSTTSARSSASILWRKLQSNPFWGFLESTCIQSNTENYFRIVTTGIMFLFSGPMICDN